MSLGEHTRLGSYEITGLIGAGGMGEVYRARDTKLGREVAIKTLPAALASDKDRLARFEREAKLLATLNHPHIAAVHSLDEHEGTRYLAMELVDGETLEEKLKPGALPVEDALRLALQIADALEAAHGKGVIHRDLKPANIMVNAQGQVKVLDFGLAKAFGTEPAEASPGQSPALSLAMTQQGLILGTAGYMSPEQASGQSTDQRADIWAFGVVLYEMLTGLPLFRGESVPHILADVLKTEPDWNRLPADLHPLIRHMLERCLTKKPRNRYHSIADARVDIQQVLSDPQGSIAGMRLGEVGAASRPTAPASRGRRYLPWAAGLVLATLVGLGAWQLKPEAARPVTRFVHEFPEGRSLFMTGHSMIDIARDGRRLVYNSTDGVVVRELDAIDDRLIAGTQGIRIYPRLSPDGESLAYVRSGDSGAPLVRQAITGGVIVELMKFALAPGGGDLRGINWEKDGTLLLAKRGSGIWRVSENGGEPELIVATGSAAEEDLLWPALLPGGEWVLFTLAQGDSPTRFDSAAIVAQSLITGERRSLRSGANSGRYSPTGHLVYGAGSTLFAVAFDPNTLAVSGGPVPVVQGVHRERSGGMQYAFADDGTLIYVPGSAVDAEQISLAIGNGQGQAEALATPTGEYANPRAAPVARWIAYGAQYNDGSDIAVYEIGSSAAPRRLSFGGDNTLPAWSADGMRVAYSSSRADGPGIYWRLADGTGAEERLTQAAEGETHLPESFSPDGKYLVYMIRADFRSAIWLLELATHETSLLIESPGRGASHAVFSPDGRWLAYQAYDTGDNEIFVQPFPLTGAKYQLPSRGDNHHPLWSADGRQLYYIAGPTSFERVEVSTERGFSFGNPVAANLAPLRNLSPIMIRGYDIMPDGSGILGTIVGNADAGDTNSIVVVQNWFEELKRLVPVD